MKKALLLLLLSMPLLCIVADTKNEPKTRRKCCPGPRGPQGPQGLQGPQGPLLIPFLTTSTDIAAFINAPTEFLSTLVTATGTRNYLVLYNMSFLTASAGQSGIFADLFVNGTPASDVNGNAVACNDFADGNLAVIGRGNMNLSAIVSLSQGDTVTVQVDPDIVALDVESQYLVLIQLN